MKIQSITCLSLIVASLVACQEPASNTPTVAAPKAQPAAQAAVAKIDISGYHLADKVYTGGMPSAEQMQAFAEEGVKTVFDFRTPKEGTAEQQAVVEGLGMKYINIPLTKALASPEQVKQFSEAFALAKQDKVLLHCRSGNRAGMIWSLAQMADGVELEQAIAEGKAKGMKSGFEDLVRKSAKLVN